MKKHTTSRQRGSVEAFAMIGFALLLVIGFIAYTVAWNGARETRTCVVTEKLATAQKEGGTNYLLFTKNCGQLQIADSILNGNFNSTDLYASIKTDTSYTFETVGWRNGFFSSYPNVVKVGQ